MKKVVLLILGSLLLLKLVVLSPGCASVIPPTGGPRDSLPPMLISVNPPDSSRNFTGKRINFVFNEFVQLDNIQQNLLISPTPKINPTIEAKLRTVTVQIKDTLEPNTTYTIDFGNALRDINEGNPFRNFTYLFSTGSTIDSLEISGKLIIAETGKSDSTLIVMLHTNMNDSAVINERPRYVTRLDREGNFRFRNLPADTFAVYALKDESGVRRYLSKAQLFAFLDSPVVSNLDRQPIMLYAYTEKTETKPAKTQPDKPSAPGPMDKRLRVETNLESGQLDLLKNLEIYFNAAPLKYFDSSRLQFVNEEFSEIPNVKIIEDTNRKKITVMYPWTENSEYHILIDKDFAEDSTGRKLLRNDTLSFRTKKTTEYGLVRLRFLNLNLSRNPVLQFVQNNEVRFSHVFTNNEFNAKLFDPGEYELRLLYDENKNATWDPGEFFGKRRQPEKIQPIPRRLTVKANWDNEVDIEL